MKKVADFPIYIKYPDGRSFVKIESPESIEEVKKIGNQTVISQLEAKTFSDRIYIKDLIENIAQGLLTIIDESEYQSAVAGGNSDV